MKITTTVIRTVPTGDGGTITAKITLSDDDDDDGEILAASLSGRAIRWLDDLFAGVAPDSHPEAAPPRRARYLRELHEGVDGADDDDGR